VYLVINDRGTTAFFEVVFPSRIDLVAFKVMMEEGISVEIPRRSHVDITSTAYGEYYKSNDSIHPSSDYRALA
jgi:hypothetical protein